MPGKLLNLQEQTIVVSLLKLEYLEAGNKDYANALKINNLSFAAI